MPQRTDCQRLQRSPLRFEAKNLGRRSPTHRSCQVRNCLPSLLIGYHP
ncbi:hypothetical protein [Vacuolonema iberomarrocanum]|nr:hypothetical protein [filamentous cyanobacterium LEGE 07170]